MGYLNALFSFEGRAARLTYWRFQVLQAAVAAALLILASFGTIVGGWLGAVPLACIPLLLLTGFCVTVRRLHDRGRSAWWALLFTIGPWTLVAPSQGLSQDAPPPVVLGAAVLAIAGAGLALWAWVEIGFLRGAKGANRYGPEPSNLDLAVVSKAAPVR
jgi:uncharacterized membrane protein YhaH (DUF805 family)